MAPRANWKGYLRLSLVSCPIALYPASSLSEKVSFNRINRKTGNRLKQQNIDSETGDVVPREDTARGFEVAKGQYLIVEDQEIDAVQIESTRTIEIDQFVPRSEIDDRYIDSPYYIAPDGKVGQDAFAVIRDTIAKMGMVALGRVVLRAENTSSPSRHEAAVWWDLPCAIPTRFAMSRPISRTFPI
jgi:DNA end-binding protein Ku